MSEIAKIETRSLIVDGRGEFIIPTSRDKRLTFSREISQDNDESRPLHELVQRALATELGLAPLAVRRHLGHIGASQAYLLTPHVGKNLERDFTWRRRNIDDVVRMIKHDNEIDPDDSQIFDRYLELQAKGEFGPVPFEHAS
jgi:hypothetical protein